MEVDKQGMLVMTWGKAEHQGWTKWIHQPNFGRVGGCLTGGEKIMILDGE